MKGGAWPFPMFRDLDDPTAHIEMVFASNWTHPTGWPQRPTLYPSYVWLIIPVTPIPRSSKCVNHCLSNPKNLPLWGKFYTFGNSRYDALLFRGLKDGYSLASHCKHGMILRRGWLQRWICTNVDSKNPAPPVMYQTPTKKYNVLCIWTGTGFLPSTALWEFDESYLIEAGENPQQRNEKWIVHCISYCWYKPCLSRGAARPKSPDLPWPFGKPFFLFAEDQVQWSESNEIRTKKACLINIRILTMASYNLHIQWVIGQ